MARSYKKNPWIKDYGKFKQYAKRLSAKIMRKKTKERLSKENFDVMPIPYECVNQYDICDWKFMNNNNSEFVKGHFIYAKGKSRLRK